MYCIQSERFPVLSLFQKHLDSGLPFLQTPKKGTILEAMFRRFMATAKLPDTRLRKFNCCLVTCVNDSLPARIWPNEVASTQNAISPHHILYIMISQGERERGGTMHSVVYRRVYRFAGQAYNALKKKLKESEKGRR